MRQSTKMYTTYVKRSLLGKYTTTMFTIGFFRSLILRCFHHVISYPWKVVDWWRSAHRRYLAGARIGSLRRQRQTFPPIRLPHKVLEDSLPANFPVEKVMLWNTSLLRAT